MIDHPLQEEEMKSSFNPNHYPKQSVSFQNKNFQSRGIHNIPQTDQTQQYFTPSSPPPQRSYYVNVPLTQPQSISSPFTHQINQNAQYKQQQNQINRSLSPAVVFSYKANNFPQYVRQNGQPQNMYQRTSNTQPGIIISKPMIQKIFQESRPIQLIASQTISPPMFSSPTYSQFMYERPQIIQSFSQKIPNNFESPQDSIKQGINYVQSRYQANSIPQQIIYSSLHPPPNFNTIPPNIAQIDSQNQPQYVQPPPSPQQQFYEEKNEGSFAVGSNQDVEQGEYAQQNYNQNDANQVTFRLQQHLHYFYEKYAIVYQKYEEIIKQTGVIADQFLQVDSEEAWLALKQKYDQHAEHMSQVNDQYTHILQEMAHTIQQNQTVGRVENSNNQEIQVWQHRYQELLEQYQSLSHHYSELQSNAMPNTSNNESEQLATINQKYSQLQEEYNSVVQQLQNAPNSNQSREDHEDLLKYAQQLQGYIEQLEADNANLMNGMNNSVQNSKIVDQRQVRSSNEEKDVYIQRLTHIIAQLEQQMKQLSENQPRRGSLPKNVLIAQLQKQLHEIKVHSNEIQQRMTIKEYQIGSLNDKIAFLQEQVQIKDEEIANNGKLLHQRLTKIQAEIQIKNKSDVAPTTTPVAPSQLRQHQIKLDQDYDNHLKQYQKIIASKNNEIHTLEERIRQCEAETRKLHTEKMKFMTTLQQQNTNLQDGFVKRIREKESKIKELELSIEQLSAENQKIFQQKDYISKQFQLEVAKIRENSNTRISEKQTTMKNLKDLVARLENQIKERNIQISRIRMNSSSNFEVDVTRYEQQIKLLNDQVERRTDENNKLKKERDIKNKQYKDLEQDYDSLQQQNNKRRIEVNNLKRQSSNTQNLQFQIENLKTTITKRNQQINELKNMTFEIEKVNMEVHAKNRQIQKLNQIIKLNNKNIEQITEQNYQLEQKLRQKDFIINTQKLQLPAQRNGTFEEGLALQQQLRKKQIELSKFKVESQELERVNKRIKEELCNLKEKYPLKVQQTEEESNDIKQQLMRIQKKYSLSESRCKQLEQMSKKIKIVITEEMNTQNLRLKQYYVKFIDKQQSQLKLIKEKARNYELKINDYELQVERLDNLNKQQQINISEYQRKISYIHNQLERQQEEIRTFREKQNKEITLLKTKEGRCNEIQMQIKLKDSQMRELIKKNDSLTNNIKLLNKEFNDYKQSASEKMEATINKEIQNISQQISIYESKMASQVHHLDFKSKNTKNNQVFERKIIYELKEQNQRLRRELQGQGVTISLQKLKITQMQQQALLKSKILVQKEDQSHSQQINFYKQKNKQLQQRVNSHVTMNKNLKQRLDYLLQQNTKYEHLDKLKTKITQLEKKQIKYQQTIAKLIDQNKEAKEQANEVSPSMQIKPSHQFKLNEENARIHQISLEKNTIQQELTSIKIERGNLQKKCLQVEKQLQKVTNQYIVYKFQIQKLNKSKNQKENQSNTQCIELKTQIDELTKKLKDRESQSEQLRYLSKQIHQLMAELKNKDLALQQQSYKLKDLRFQYQYLKEKLQKTTERQKQNIQQQIFELNEQTNEQFRKSKELQSLKKKNQQLQESLNIMTQNVSQLQSEYMHSKEQNKQLKGNSCYYIELIRSSYLQVETLTHEIDLQSKRMVAITDQIIQNSQRGLQSCQYLYELLSQ